MAQKGTSIDGGLVTEEALASSDSIFDKGSYGSGQKGFQQFYSPPSLAALVKHVIGPRLSVLDPTAGDGSLLKGFDPPFSFGVELDKDQIANAEGSYNAIRGDLQHVYSLIKLAIPSWSAIVANPPFGLMWEDPTVRGGKPTNSALMTFLFINRLLSEDGQFVFVDGKNHFHRAIEPLAEAKGIYAVIYVDDLFEGTKHPCAIAFGIHPENRSEGSSGFQGREVTANMLDLCGDWVRELRQEALGPYNYLASHTYGHHILPDNFKGIQQEYDRRVEHRLGTRKREYDAQLVGGKVVQWLPSAFAQIALRQTGDAYAFEGLNGQSANYFIQNERLWNKLIGFADSGLVRVDPRLKEKVGESMLELKKEICPLYHIKPQQRLGYLADVEYLKCIKDDPEFSFVAGESYRLGTKTQTVVTEDERVVESKKTPGEFVTKKFRKAQKSMQITVGRWTFLDSGGDASGNIAKLIEHFDLPDPGEVMQKHPEEITRLEELCFDILDNQFLPNSQEWEKTNAVSMPYSHRDFQKQDIARLVFKGGGLLSWAQGLGKTIGGMLFAEAAVREGAQDAKLFITAGDLIPQWQREFKRFYGKEATLITSHAQAKKIAKYLKQPGSSGLFLTYYEALSLKGTKGKNGSQPMDTVTVYEKVDHAQVKGTGRYGYCYLGDCESVDGETGQNTTVEGYIPCKGRFDEDVPEDKRETVTYGYIPPRYKRVVKPITSREVCPECRADTRNGWNGLYCEAEKQDGSKCGYAHYKVRVKPIASILSRAFKNGIIVIDEITLMQGDTSARSRALRGLQARYRLGMTGTPIKNYIAQAFWPLWWCLRDGSTRLGYRYVGGRTKFEGDFSVIEWEIAKGKLQARKALPEVTNLSMFWRLLASSTIRRQKEETGEVLMPKFYYDINTPLGIAQREQTDKWLKDFPRLFEQKYPDAPVVKANMHEIMAPMLGLQQKLDYACTIPLADPDWEWTGIEGVSNWTPSMLKTIELTMALAKQGKKVLVGSNLVATSQFVADTLVQKGVKAIHILDEDGKTANKEKRAQRVYSFQTDDVQVFCAGVKAIRLGHNLDAAEAVVLHGLDWDFETLDQFVNRVHRLTSKNPIHVYVVLPRNDSGDTFTTKKWSILGMKGQAAELALDGRLLDRHETELDKSQVVRDLMARGITATGDEIDEVQVEDVWRSINSFEDYEVPEGLIPDPPYEITDEGKEAATVVGQFLKALAPKRIVSDDTNFVDLIPDVIPVEAYEEDAPAPEPSIPDALAGDLLPDEMPPAPVVHWVQTAEEAGYVTHEEQEAIDVMLDELPIEDEGAEPQAVTEVEGLPLTEDFPETEDDVAGVPVPMEGPEDTEEVFQAEVAAGTPDLVALAAQMAEMQAQMQAMAEKNATLEAEVERLSTHEQLTMEV